MAQKISGPDFICIGAQKAGTGWLYEQLRSHPDFWMPPLKEIHYFDRLGQDRQSRQGEKEDRVEAARKIARDDRDLRFLSTMDNLRALPGIELDRYAQMFDSKEGLISGDITPGYSTLSEEMVGQVVQSLPNAKIIFIARDPVERAWSQLSMWIRHGVIDQFDPMDSSAVARNLQLPGVEARSYPSRIVARWRRSVRPELFGLYFFDDIQSDSARARCNIISFLGGDPEKESGALSADHNPKATKQKLSLGDDVRASLAKFFESELKSCAAELGGPATKWPARYGF